MEAYFRRWRLRPNPLMTITSTFPLNTQQASPALKVSFCGAELEDQLQFHRSQLAKKDELIRTLTLLREPADSPSDVTSSPGLSKVTFGPPAMDAAPRTDALPHYGLPVDMLRSEYAAMLVKYESSQTQVRDLRERLAAKEAALLLLRGELEQHKEHEARQVSLIQSLKGCMREAQERPGTVGTGKTQANCSIHSLQGHNEELSERIAELEERLRLHLREREQSEQRAAGAERRLTASIQKLARGLGLDSEGQREPLDYLTNKACELFQEHLLWETKMAALEEALANQELEFRASRQALMKLVSEAGKAEQTAASFNEDMKALRKEKDEALLLKKRVDQENELLCQRLKDSQRALGTACQAQALNEKQVSEMDDSLRTSAYQTRAASVLHQSFLDQLATWLSNGFISVPATEEAIKSKVREICGNERTRIATASELEEQIVKLNEQLERRNELYRETLGRSRRAEERLKDQEEALRHLEGQLAAEDLLKGGRQFERQKHVKFLQQLAERMRVEWEVQAGDWESRSQILLARAQQIAEMDIEGPSEQQELLHSLQRKVTSQRDKLASNRRHIELLAGKLGQLEASAPGRQTHSALEQTTQRLQEELSETKIANRGLRVKCAEITALKSKNKEQSRDVERLGQSLEKLEKIKDKAAQKVLTLKSELDRVQGEAWERSERDRNTLAALGNELRSTKRALEEVARRERQLVDFREFVTSALGFDTNSMAIPDDRIYRQLKGLVQAQRCPSPPAEGLGVGRGTHWAAREGPAQADRLRVGSPAQPAAAIDGTKMAAAAQGFPP
uniref:coiled-coil domain-containing protein 170-like n=1 Tax=Pristiophorus japonicus TaxID=55135 RepID=UPI00398F1E36